MRKNWAWVEAVALTVGTVLALAGSVAFVVPGHVPERAADGERVGWVAAWNRAGGEVVAVDGEPELRALEAWSRVGLAGEPASVRFVHPERGTVARALIAGGGDGSVLVFEAGRQARLLHPAIGTANLEERGHVYLARAGGPVERISLD